MSGTGEVSGGRPLLRGRLFGFPVHLDISFVIIMGLLGYYPDITARDFVLWLLITPLAVLVHELGHAVLARAAGAQPAIALAGFGGVTTFVPPRPLSRARSLTISLAGPFVGLVIGGVLLVVAVTYRDEIVPLSWQESVLRIGIFTCLGWSLLNLLPVLPLDGGQAMRELLPGGPEVRARRAAGVSVAVALVAAVIAYLYFGQIFVALFLVFFAVSNGMELRRPTGGQEAVSPEHVVVGLLWQNQADRARQVMESLPEGMTVDLAVHGAVLSLTGDRRQGHALLEQERRARPDDARVLSLLVLVQALEHEWDAVFATLEANPRTPMAAVERAAVEARGVGREDVAGRLELIRNEPPPL